MAEAKNKNEAAKIENNKAEAEAVSVDPKAEAEAASMAPGEELVDYSAPFLPGENRQDIFVAVNGESLVIKRGVKVKIKRKFYEVLMNAQAQELKAYQAMEAAKRQGEKAITNM